MVDKDEPNVNGWLVAAVMDGVVAEVLPNWNREAGSAGFVAALMLPKTNGDFSVVVSVV